VVQIGDGIFQAIDAGQQVVEINRLGHRRVAAQDQTGRAGERAGDRRRQQHQGRGRGQCQAQPGLAAETPTGNGGRGKRAAGDRGRSHGGTTFCLINQWCGARRRSIGAGAVPVPEPCF